MVGSVRGYEFDLVQKRQNMRRNPRATVAAWRIHLIQSENFFLFMHRLHQLLHNAEPARTGGLGAIERNVIAATAASIATLTVLK